MRRNALAAATLTVVLVLTGCASARRPGDRAFQAGDYPAAAAAYEDAIQRTPAARADPDLLLRLAIAYARPNTTVYEPERAVEILKEVVTRFGGDRAAREAALLLPNLEQEVRLAAAVASAKRTIADLEGELARARSEAHALDTAAKAREDQLVRLRASLADVQSQLRRVRDELDQLKRIDLQHRP
jgi:hypothetical protein